MAINQSNSFFPVSFQDYLKNNELPTTNTAASISIDSIEKLNPLLRSEQTMVFRLAASDSGTGTQFALRKVNVLREYFLIDDEVFTDKSGSEYSIEQSPVLLAFKALPHLSETSLVNLGLATGLVGRALGLSDEKVYIGTATCQAAFTFSLKLHSEDVSMYLHNRGQIEIDSMFVADRNGHPTLFVVEAKSETTHLSLSKHKLVYPILAISDRVPPDIPIVPDYVKVYEVDDFSGIFILLNVHFLIQEQAFRLLTIYEQYLINV